MLNSMDTSEFLKTNKICPYTYGFHRAIKLRLWSWCSVALLRSCRSDRRLFTPTPCRGIVCSEMKVAELADLLQSFKDEVLSEISQIKSQTAEIGALSVRVNEIQERVDSKIAFIQKQLYNLEGQSRRSNIIIHGVPENEADETWEVTETKVLDLTRNKLEIAEPISIDRCHRLGRKRATGPRPIIAKLTFFKEKQKVFSQASKLKGTGVSISEDYIKPIRESRSKLVPMLKSARAKGKRASLQYDKLVIEGEKYVVNSEGKVTSLRTGEILNTSVVENW